MADTTFKEFVLDQLQGLDGLEARPMFGGYGLYWDGEFFGIIFNGALYFKTTEKNVQKYIEHGMKQFRPGVKQKLKNYYEVPPGVIENVRELEHWAAAASNCA